MEEVLFLIVDFISKNSTHKPRGNNGFFLNRSGARYVLHSARRLTCAQLPPNISPPQQVLPIRRTLARSLTVFVRVADPDKLPFRALVPLPPPVAPPPLLLVPCGMRRICSFMLTATCVFVFRSSNSVHACPFFFVQRMWRQQAVRGFVVVHDPRLTDLLQKTAGKTSLKSQ